MVGGPTASAILSSPVRGTTDNPTASVPQSPVNLSSSMKEDENASFPSRRPSPALADVGLAKAIGRGSVVGGISSQVSGIPLSSGNGIPSDAALGGGSPVSDIAKRNILGADERIGNGGLAQSMVSPLSNRMLLQQASRTSDGTVSTESSIVGEGAVIGGRVFSPSAVPGVQWRPHNTSSFPNTNEMVCFLLFHLLRSAYVFVLHHQHCSLGVFMGWVAQPQPKPDSGCKCLLPAQPALNS